MKKLLLLFALAFVAMSCGDHCPSNEIWYTSADGNIVEPYGGEDDFTIFGANIVSNEYDADKECWVITFDGDVTTIGDWAFYDCSTLTSVTIPDSVTAIGNQAFYWCESLTSVTIPDSVTTIGCAAFVNCSSLTSVTIGDGVTTIGGIPFYGCSSLIEFRGKYASEDGRCLIIDGTLNSFAPAGLAEYTIPDSVTTIGDWVFQNCSSLTSVTIPDSVTTIGEGAFSGCSSLTSVTIPDSVTTIRAAAFVNCSNLNEFNGKYASEDGRCLIIDGKLNSFAPAGLAEYTIPDSVTTIWGFPFVNRSSLTSVTIPDSVTTIGDSAFYGCSGLTSVYCKAVTPPTVDYDMFDNNASGRKIYVPRKSVKAYKTAEGWSKYADYIVGYDF